MYVMVVLGWIIVAKNRPTFISGLRPPILRSPEVKGVARIFSGAHFFHKKI